MATNRCQTHNSTINYQPEGLALMAQTSDARGLWGVLLAAQDRWPRCRRRHPGLEAVLLCSYTWYLDPS